MRAFTASTLLSHVWLSFSSLGRSRRVARVPASSGGRVHVSWASSPTGTRSEVSASVLCTHSAGWSVAAQLISVVSCTASTNGAAATRSTVACTWLSSIAAGAMAAFWKNRYAAFSSAGSSHACGNDACGRLPSTVASRTSRSVRRASPNAAPPNSVIAQSASSIAGCILLLLCVCPIPCPPSILAAARPPADLWAMISA